MTDTIEDRVAQALAQRVATMPADAVQRISAVDYRPRRHRIGKRTVITGSAGSATVAGTVAAILLTGAQPAFAGWRAAPTALDAASSTTACAQQLSSASAPGEQSEQWTPVLTDTRGPYQVTSYTGSNSGTATCFTGPSFTRVSTSSANGGLVTVGSAAGGTSDTTVHSGSSSQTNAQASGPITEVGTGHFTLDNDGPYTIVTGQTAGDVTNITLVRSDGQDVTATVGDGQFVAWWPGDADATSAQVTTTSGTVDEPLPASPAGH